MDKPLNNNIFRLANFIDKGNSARRKGVLASKHGISGKLMG
jgi:hypothetical protein